MKAAQLSPATFASRHEELIRDIHDIVPDAAKALSFGCSYGFEAIDLQRYLTKAQIFGCDVNLEALKIAHTRCAEHGIKIFESNAANICQHGPYDAITCLNVLVRYPGIQDKPNIRDIYPFADFDRTVALLVSCLKPGGVLAVYNSCYLVDDSSSSSDLISTRGGRHNRNGWIDKYDCSGSRLTRSSGVLSGVTYPLAKWRQALVNGRQLTDKACINDLTEHRLRYKHQFLTSRNVDLKTTLWRKFAPHFPISKCANTRYQD